jgi:hypothetical protein
VVVKPVGGSGTVDEEDIISVNLKLSSVVVQSEAFTLTVQSHYPSYVDEV